MSVQKIVEQVEKLTVLELNELVKALEKKFGVPATPVVAASTVASGEGGSQPVAEEKSNYDVILANAGANKIAVIKAVRGIKPELGLKEAKDLVDTAPKAVLEQAKKEDAEAAKTKLETAGAQVELK